MTTVVIVDDHSIVRAGIRRAWTTIGDISVIAEILSCLRLSFSCLFDTSSISSDAHLGVIAPSIRELVSSSMFPSHCPRTM